MSDISGKLLLILGCDCDPDRSRYGGARYDVHRSGQTWRGVSEGIGLLEERLKRIENATGLKPKVIFCLRSDVQMSEIYGTPSWAIQQDAAMWKRLADEGHELAWHPHLWRWVPESGCWIQETEDAEWISHCLEFGFCAFSKATGVDPTTCHMGWTFQNNITMKKLADLGVKIDFSASPGVYFPGGPGDGGTVFDNKIDWLGTPQGWYYPSEADYRRPAAAGETELSIAEIPKFTSQSAVLKKVKHLASRGKNVPGSIESTNVFLQVTVLPALYRLLISERFKCEEAGPFFATYFHPDELLRNRSRSGRMFLYSLDNLEKNLVGIISASRKKGRDVAFVTGAEALQVLREQRHQ